MMEKFSKFLFAFLMVFAVVSVSCNRNNDDDDDDVTVDNKFGTLKTYLVDNSMDLPDVLDAWITTAANVHTTNTDSVTTNDFYIIDIRSATDFAAGHIDGAVNSTLANIVTEAANAAGQTIIVACYSGQTASHAVIALRLSGFPTAKVMKWGMSGWTDAAGYDRWTSSCASIGVGNSNWTAAPGSPTANYNFGDPVLESTNTAGADILSERVTAMLSGGFKGVASADVLADPSAYFINNYWALTDLEHYGHISGAYRILPLTLAGNEYQNLNPDATVVTYCWTGQTSSMITAYLNVIGYTAKSLKNGANSMIHSELTSHKWDASLAKQFTVVTK